MSTLSHASLAVLQRRMSGVVLDVEPFPHVYADNFLPPGNKGAPEPGTLVSGLVGSALVAVRLRDLTRRTLGGLETVPGLVVLGRVSHFLGWPPTLSPTRGLSNVRYTSG